MKIRCTLGTRITDVSVKLVDVGVLGKMMCKTVWHRYPSPFFQKVNFLLNIIQEMSSIVKK